MLEHYFARPAHRRSNPRIMAGLSDRAVRDLAD